MSDTDRFLETIEAVYASGLDHDCWPNALEAMNGLLGGAGATLEAFDMKAQRSTEFLSVGAPTAGETQYVEQFAALNPRAPYAARQRSGTLLWDYQVLDEDEMARNPFYTDFLPSLGLYYCLGAILDRTPNKLVAVAIHRTHRQGHVDQREIALMRKLLPHFQRAYDTATRLTVANNRNGFLENAFDWLTDGVALMSTDGYVIYANETLRALAQCGDGFRIAGRTIEFMEPVARRRFDAALGALGRIGEPSSDAVATDFAAARSSGMPAYIVSIRPLVHGENHRMQLVDAKIIMFVRDPLLRNGVTIQILQDLFSLTKAEAHLAQALCTGTTTGAYATERCVSLNTVYSHLKRIREKTGCKSVPELILKFSELNVPLRPAGPSGSA